jgi:hypothetical protein
MSPGWKNPFADAPICYLINQIRSVSPSIQGVRQSGDRAVFARPLVSPHFSSRIIVVEVRAAKPAVNLFAAA